MKISDITFREVNKKDKDQIASFISKHWGCDLVVVHNDKYVPSELEGFIALYKDQICGLITYVIQKNKCEVVTINSEYENLGIGTKLLEMMIKLALKRNCSEIWLITTNDNIRAIGFYQKKGFHLVKVYPNAVNKSRDLKPEIPVIADNGIPIRDELEFRLKITYNDQGLPKAAP